MYRKLILLTSVTLVLALATSPANGDAFQQGPDGIVSVEAENFHDNVAQGGHEWVQVGPTDGFTGVAGMQALPDKGTNRNTGYVEKSPRLDFKVEFLNTGTHYVWIRAWGPSGSGDSCHAGLDNQANTTANRISGWNQNYSWQTERMSNAGPAFIEVPSAGVHTLNVWMREDGLIVDKIVLTTDPNYVPADDGPPESARAPILKAYGPNPATGTEGLLIGSTLSWQSGDTAVSHDVYFGTTDPPAFIGNQAETSYYPAALAPGTTHYWRIDEVEADGTVHTGDVWSFTTGFSNLVIDIGIAVQEDDVEEHGDWDAHKMESLTSSDLEMPYEDKGMGEKQIIGLRFTNVTIPKGATINAASVQFQVDETKDGDLPVNLIIEGELSPDAAPFVREAFNVTSRPRTTAQVQWSVPSWTNVGDRGPDQATSDISSIIQEIVNQDSWTAGNSLVLIISDDPANPSQGIRCAEAGPGGDAPLLHVEAASEIATQPSPADGAVDVPLDAVLSWWPGFSAVSHNGYFGTTSPPPFFGNTTDISFDASGLLVPGTTYYWRLDAVAADRTIFPGDIWSFTTMPGEATQPNPADGAVSVALDATLSWQPGVTAVSHDVYFGPVGPPAFTYSYEGDAAVAGPADNYDSLDGSWDHNNGSDQWDGTGPGAGRPGGAAALTEDTVTFLRIQDTGDPRDYGMGDPGSNRKVYFTRPIDTGLDGARLEVRARVATTPPLDDAHPDGGAGIEPWPAGGIGYHIRDDGKGMFGISDGVGIISFSLAKAGEPGFEDLTTDVLVMNNLVGNTPSADVDTGDTAVASNMIAVADVTQWHTFTIDIAAGGAGTHVVSVSVDGEPAQAFDVTVGDGVEAGVSYITIGSSGTGGITAFDVDYITVSGPPEPPPFIGNQVESTFDPGPLDAGTTYSWKVDEIAADGTKYVGAIWTFTTLTPPPAEWTPLDIATTGGSTSYDPATGTFTIIADGADIWGSADEFHYCYQKPTLTRGDVTLIARVVDFPVPAGGNNWQKAGLMIRETLDAGSKFAAVYITGTKPDGTPTQGCRFQERAATDGSASSDSSVATDEQKAIIAPYWVKLERTGNDFNAYYSSDPATDPWHLMVWSPQTIGMADEVYVGLAVTSHKSGFLTTAVFDNVSISTPDPYIAGDPVPADGATDVSRTPTLSWAPGITAASHDVYFGDSDPPAFIGNQTETNYSPPGMLDKGKTYYWRIDEVEADGTTKHTGDVWSFTVTTTGR